jgi:hypothetical protein
MEEMVFFFGPGKQQWIVAKAVVMIMFCRE